MTTFGEAANALPAKLKRAPQARRVVRTTGTIRRVLQERLDFSRRKFRMSFIPYVLSHADLSFETSKSLKQQKLKAAKA
jgi:hypothetical protein